MKKTTILAIPFAEKSPVVVISGAPGVKEREKNPLLHHKVREFDTQAKVFQDLKAVGRALGMPTSVLVDGSGCEIATIAGPAEWDSDDAVKLITAAVTPAAAGL